MVSVPDRRQHGNRGERAGRSDGRGGSCEGGQASGNQRRRVQPKCGVVPCEVGCESRLSTSAPSANSRGGSSWRVLRARSPLSDRPRQQRDSATTVPEHAHHANTASRLTQYRPNVLSILAVCLDRRFINACEVTCMAEHVPGVHARPSCSTRASGSTRSSAVSVLELGFSVDEAREAAIAATAKRLRGNRAQFASLATFHESDMNACKQIA